MAFTFANPGGTGTDQELLDFTRAAIAQVTLQGQAYTTEGFEMTRADLPALLKAETHYEAKVAASSSKSKNNLASIQRAR